MSNEIEPAKQIDKIVSAVGPRIRGDVMWLVPEGERHFDGAEVAKLVAEALANAFMAALLEDAAKASMGWLVGRLKTVFTDKAEPLPAEVAKAAREGPASLSQPEARDEALASAEADLSAALTTQMPEPEAKRIAGAVREEVNRRVFVA